MNFDWDGVYIGIVSTLFVTAILWLLKSQIWPRLRNLLQKGPKVSGEWISTFREDGVEKSETVVVTQLGEKINGLMTLTEQGLIIKSKFRGTIQSGVIKGLYENQNPEGFEQGAFALHLEPRGDQATGQYIYFLSGQDGSSSEITASDYIWKRSKGAS